MATSRALGTLALVGGGAWSDPCRALDADLLERSGASEVVVVPTAAAFEQPARRLEAAAAYFDALGCGTVGLDVLHRAEAEDDANATRVRDARFVYVADGSPLHLRSVLKDSKLFEALVAAYRGGATVVASGAGATVLCDPMVDPRGGAYTVGLGLVGNLAVFPYHGSAADHLRVRSVDLLPRGALLAGVDECTALVRDPEPRWRVVGAGRVTLYGARVDGGAGEPAVFEGDSVIETLKR